MDSATSCRTRWRWGWRGRSCCASRSCAPPRASFPRATCSTGGCRTAARACARTSPTTACGCRSSPRITSRSPAIAPSSTSRFHSSKVRRCRANGTMRSSSPRSASSTATLFEHCRLGLEGALYMGQHGLPLIGTGDWNDGMNRVGEHGRGESVWLGWFLHATLNAFAPIAQARGELALATAWLGQATQAARRARTARLGWRMVSPRLLRRRHAARLGSQR